MVSGFRAQKTGIWVCGGALILAAMISFSNLAISQTVDTEPVTISVVVANPSKSKTQTIPVKIDLPQEVKPEDILEKGDLDVQYNDQNSSYFLFNKEVTLKPLETRVFNVLVKNVWIIPQAKIDDFRSYTALLLERLKKSEYLETGKKLADENYQKLDGIVAKQKDETLGQKQRIGHTALICKCLIKLKRILPKWRRS